MLTPIHLRIVLPRLQQRPGAGGKLAEVFPVARHVEAADLVDFMVAVGLGLGADEVVVHDGCG